MFIFLAIFGLALLIVSVIQVWITREEEIMFRGSLTAAIAVFGFFVNGVASGYEVREHEAGAAFLAAVFVFLVLQRFWYERENYRRDEKPKGQDGS